MSFAIDEDVYLEHFGVKGMRWGHRKEAREARRIKKSQKYALRAQAFQTKISELDSRSPKSRFQQARLNKQRSELVRDRNQAIEDAQRKREGKLTDKQRIVTYGAAAVATAIAAYGTYSTVQSGQFRRVATKGKNFLTGNKEAWAHKPELSDTSLDADGIMEKVVKDINPEFGGIGTKMNCRRATFAYEMRRRGFDVQATRTSNGRGQDASGIFNVLQPEGSNPVNPGRGGIATRLLLEARAKKKGAETPFTESFKEAGFIGKNKVNPNQLWGALSKNPNGARGELGVKWAFGGGHSVAWEIVNNKPVVFDTQTGKVFKSYSQMKKEYEELTGGIQEAALTRLDNVSLNNDFLMRWVKRA